MEFGVKLKKVREENGITQQSLAEKLYVTRQAVSRWECGERYPDLITVKKISEIFNVSVDELLSNGDDFEKVKESNPLTQNRKIADIIVMSLYAILSFCSVIKLFEALIFYCDNSNMFWADFKNINFVFSVLSFFMLFLLFVYGFISGLNNKLTQKKAGIVALVFFGFKAVNLLVDVIMLSDANGVNLINILINSAVLLLYIFAFISFYLIFFKRKSTKLYNLFCITGVGFCILTSLYNFFSVFSSLSLIAGFNKLSFLISTLDSLTVCALFIYEIYLLRKNAD